MLLNVKVTTVYIYFLSIFILGTSIFLFGFFPLSFSKNEKKASLDDLPEYIENIK